MHAQVFERKLEALAIVERDFQHARAGPELDFSGQETVCHRID
jgi:hypothetical protein